MKLKQILNSEYYIDEDLIHSLTTCNNCIFSKKRNRYLKYRNHFMGYKTVVLYLNGKPYHKFIS